jgi:AraC-like DNA-binding protein
VLATGPILAEPWFAFLDSWGGFWNPCRVSSAAELPLVEYPVQWAVEICGNPATEHVPLFVYHGKEVQDWVVRARITGLHCLVVGQHGRGSHIVNAVPHRISRGDLCILGPRSDQGVTGGEGLNLYFIYFSRDIFDAATWKALREVPGFDAMMVDRAAYRRFHLDPVAYAQVEDDLDELLAEWSKCTVSSAIIARAYFVRLLVRLARLAADERLRTWRGPARQHEQIIADAVMTIDRENGVGIRVDELAASAYLSRSRFTELFVEVMGQTPSEYSRVVRLEHAKRLLAGTALPIARIAAATGFVDQSHFTRVFRAATGVTPREFRRTTRAYLPATDMAVGLRE